MGQGILLCIPKGTDKLIRMTSEGSIDCQNFFLSEMPSECHPQKCHTSRSRPILFKIDWIWC